MHDLFAAPEPHLLLPRGRRLTLEVPRIMGVVNMTPDSFSDGGRYLAPQAAIEHALCLKAAGADVIDLGAESTRPGASVVAAEVQLERLLPVIAALRAQLPDFPLSIDTSDAAVIRAVLAAGVDLINDTRALTAPGALEAVAASEAALCLMHMQGEPATMQMAPHYDDVINEVQRFLSGRLLACRMAGIAPARCLVDPGFGFGKVREHNLALLGALPRLGAAVGVPILVGLSRKRLIGELTGREADARTHGSVAAALLAVELGARVVRVHDVAATRDALAVWSALQPHRKAGLPPQKQDPLAAARALFDEG